MQYQYEEVFRERLLERKGLLHRAGRNGNSVRGLEALIGQVDAALSRFEHGSLGICKVCQDPVEADRLSQDPLVEVCLDCLTSDERQALEKDLQMAAQVQSSLLPEPSLQIGAWEIGHTYEPLGLVSGDYCDVLFTGRRDDSVFFLLGDVSGKGVAASMTMAQLHATFRSLIPFELPLPALVQRVNRLFADSTLAATFATLVVGRLDPSGAVELCNAGHNPPLLVHSDEVMPVHATGMPLGLFSKGQFGTTSFQLGEDDLLFLYTDGVTESRDSLGNEFGVDRIVSTLPGMRGERAEFVAKTSAQLVSDFRGTTQRDDDSTIMAIRRAGS